MIFAAGAYYLLKIWRHSKKIHQAEQTNESKQEAFVIQAKEYR